MKRISAHFKSWIAKKYRLLLTLCILMVAQWEIWPLKLHLAKRSIVPINLPTQLPDSQNTKRRIKKEGPADVLRGSQSRGPSGWNPLLPLSISSAPMLSSFVTHLGCACRVLPGQCIWEGSLWTTNKRLEHSCSGAHSAWYKPCLHRHTTLVFWPTQGTSPTCLSA